MKKHLLLIMLLLTVSCAGRMPTQRIYEANLPATTKLPATYGLMIGSFTADSNLYSRGIGFRDSSKKLLDSINNDNSGLDPFDYKNSKEDFVYALPPGNYEFYILSMTANILKGTRTWKNNSDFSIPFTIEAGKANYIGNINHVKRDAENVFGITIPGGGHFVISDRSNIDIPKLKSEYPYLASYPVVNIIPKSGNVPPQLVEFK